MIILRFGYRLVAYYHLLIHAIFKSMLFIGAGRVIHIVTSNTQNIRLLGNLNEGIPYEIIRLMISNFALSGVPCTSGFYRKDLIIEIFYVHSGTNIIIFILIFLSLLLTVSYSVRFFYYLFFNRRVKFYRYIYIKESGLVNISIVIIIFIRIILGSLIGWIFYFDFCVIYLSIFNKLFILGCCFLGGLLAGLVIILRKFI
ncbi:NADH-ubiquinone oxidoreductase chain 5 [Trachymyrmex cornetzi]|uniref:NADH-ubiquinone oxidoreductase chain 5 n=1 Tax=Trachymyrmex cornetzi TaxID=471704 RepID=A0A151IUC2_9HYME|nr:NADH-ubiquinone oxidoreductase chain 5 [Trachymyrmex cornetzi]